MKTSLKKTLSLGAFTALGVTLSLSAFADHASNLLICQDYQNALTAAQSDVANFQASVIAPLQADRATQAQSLADTTSRMQAYQAAIPNQKNSIAQLTAQVNTLTTNIAGGEGRLQTAQDNLAAAQAAGNKADAQKYAQQIATINTNLRSGRGTLAQTQAQLDLITGREAANETNLNQIQSSGIIATLTAAVAADDAKLNDQDTLVAQYNDRAARAQRSFNLCVGYYDLRDQTTAVEGEVNTLRPLVGQPLEAFPPIPTL